MAGHEKGLLCPYCEMVMPPARYDRHIETCEVMPDREELERKLRYSSYADLAAEYSRESGVDIKAWTVNRWATRYGLRLENVRRAEMGPADLLQALRLYRSGASTAEVSALFSMGIEATRRAVIDCGRLPVLAPLWGLSMHSCEYCKCRGLCGQFTSGMLWSWCEEVVAADYFDAVVQGRVLRQDWLEPYLDELEWRLVDAVEDDNGA